jgi:hypothetical protein
MCAEYVYVAWCLHQAPFSLLVTTVLEHLSAASLDTCVWIDIFAVNQHGVWPPGKPPRTPNEHQNKLDVYAFADVIALCEAGTLVVANLLYTNPALRGWCLYEW